MRLSYEDDLVEAAVFLTSRGGRSGVSHLQVRRFHAERERCYRVTDPEERTLAFSQLHLEWFREWGLERALIDRVAERPLLSSALSTLAFRQARARRDEGAELYVTGDGERNGVLALRPERLQRQAWLAPFLRHELLHLHDMVDPAFAYAPDLSSQGIDPVNGRIVCERYRLLWDITIDGRLRHLEEKPRHASLLERAFSFWPAGKQDAVFEELWNESHPKHDALLALAADPRDLRHAPQPIPGGTCPICGFSTFEWADTAALEESVRTALLQAFPRWVPDHGICGRCVEVYQIGSRYLEALPQ